MEAQGCTRLACECGECLLRNAMEEGPHEIPMWKVTFTLEDVTDYVPCKSENQSAYPCIEWEDRCLIEMKTLGGKIILS